MKSVKKVFVGLGILVVVFIVISFYMGFKKFSIKRELDQAENSYKSNDLSGAVEHLHNIYAKAPNTKEGNRALYLLGECYLSLDELALAKDCWTKLKDMPEAGGMQAECHFNLATIAKEMGDTPSAVTEYELVITQYPLSDFADDALWNVAKIYKDEGRLTDSRQMLNSIVEKYPQSNLISSIEKDLGDVNMKLLFLKTIAEDSVEYTVQQGDTLIGIAKKFNTTVDLIKESNNLKSNFIKPGDRLKVITAKFSILVDKNRNTLILKEAFPGKGPEEVVEKVVKVYSVGTGTSGCTPAGEFKITNKLINPPWFKSGKGVVPFGDPDNVLGTRWMGFNVAGYGIHGTWEPESIGKQASAGCVRMLNEDVEELFKIVPSGTVVTVVE